MFDEKLDSVVCSMVSLQSPYVPVDRSSREVYNMTNAAAVTNDFRRKKPLLLTTLLLLLEQT